jgi:hypothetical protein
LGTTIQTGKIVSRDSLEENISQEPRQAQPGSAIFHIEKSLMEHPARGCTDNEFSQGWLRGKRGRALKLKTIYTTSQKLKTRLSLSSTRTV